MKEFKIIKFEKPNKSYELIEKSLEQKSSEGWEVVNMTMDMCTDIRGTMLVLLQREKQQN